MGEVMEKILVNGYFGVNFGDDLFFKILFERYSNTKFYFYNNSYLQHLNDKYKCIYKEYNNVRVKKYNKLRRLFEKVNNTAIVNFIQYAQYDAAVFIGGSIFMETNIWENSYKEKLSTITYFFNMKKPIYVVGSNFGPFNTEKFKQNYIELFKKCKDVCFRDNYSFELFKEMGNVRVAPDIVFQLKPKNIEKNRNTLGISLIDLSERDDLLKYEEVYINKIVDIIEEAVSKGIKITLFSFCEAQGDMTIIQKVIKNVDVKSKSYIEIENYNGNIDGFLNKFESMENIIGTRFHACILSQVFGQGLYPIIYSDKTYNVLKDIGLNKEYTYIKDLDKLDPKHVLDVISKNKISDKKIFKEAEMQFKGLDSYVNK